MEVAVAEKSRQLVDKAVTLKKEIQQKKAQLDEVTAELARICERVLSDKGVKSAVVYGSDGNGVIITSPVKVNIVSYEKLIGTMGEAMVNEYAPLKVVPTVREPKTEFLQVLSDIVLDDYIEDDLASFIDKNFEVAAEQKAILIKKLKGIYAKDLKVLTAMMGERDYDVELYHISKIINYQRILKWLPKETEASIAAIKESVAVDEGIKTEVYFKS